MRPRSPPAWAGRREGSFHGHEGEVVTLTRGCISPSPQPSPIKGEGEEPSSQSSPPPNGGRRGSPCPSAPLDSGPVSSTGQAFRRNDGVMQGSPPYRVRGRLFDKLRTGSRPSPVKGPSQGVRDKRAGFKPAPTGANGCPPATSPTGGRTRGSAPTVGPASIPLIPSLSRAAPGRAGFKPAPTGAALRGVGPALGESPSPHPSPVKGEGVRALFRARFSVV